MEGRQVGSFLGDDPFDQPSRLEGLGVDDQPSTFRAAQDQQVLDESMESLGLGTNIFKQGRARCRIVGAPGTGQDLGKSEDGGDRRAQLMADDVDEGFAELPGPTLFQEQLVALLLDATTLREQYAEPGAGHHHCLQYGQVCALTPQTSAKPGMSGTSSSMPVARSTVRARSTPREEVT